MLHPKSRVAAAAVGVVAFFSTAALAADPARAPAFGGKGTVKVRVAPSLVTPEVLRSGVRVVANYGSFVVVETTPDLVTPGDVVEVMTDANKILLGAATLDTSEPAVQQLRKPRGNFAGKSLHLVQFAGPIQRAWLDDLKKTGVEVVEYMASNAYLVYGDAKQIAALQALAAQVPHVQWEAPFADAYKIDRAVAARQSRLNAVAKAPTGSDNLYTVTYHMDPQADNATLAAIDRLKAGPVMNSYSVSHYQHVIVPLAPADVAEVAKQPNVVAILPYTIPTLFCERQDQIVAGNLTLAGTNATPSGPGYLAWFTSKGFTQAQFDASGFAVDVSDSPLDNGKTTPNHFGLWKTGNPASTSRVAYNYSISGTTITNPNAYTGLDGHGNLNCHIVGGYDATTNFPFADSSGYHYGLGVCPFVRVGNSTIFSSGLAFLSPNYSTLQNSAYANGARISSNSWGSQTDNTYSSDCQSYDTLVRDAQSGVGGNQEMVIVFANGNAGSGANSARSPATAKNVISVGAAENVQAFGGSDGSGISDSGANNANDIISFSSRGPCSDGRIKPEIMAPGTHVSGGASQANTNTTGTGTVISGWTGAGVSGGVSPSKFFPSSGQQFYTASSGTSHSCPGVAGGCAVVRQYFINLGLNPPSPAMTKAFLMNSARYMNGVGANDTLYSNNQGMGMMNLGEAFNRVTSNTVLRDELAADVCTNTGDTRTFTGTVADITKPFRVTLAWSDAPSAPTSGAAYKNNLDLTVTVGANTYKGNVFTGANSVTGGAADIRNNAESVFLAAGVSGAYTVTVTATSINSDGLPGNADTTDQDFALVIYNSASFVCPTITLSPSSPLPGGTVGTSYSQTFTASGGTAPYGWTVSAGSPPAGLNLSTNGILSGIPTAAGTSNFTVRAADANSCASTNAYSLTIVCPTIGITPISLPNGTVNAPYSQLLTASGGSSPYTWAVTAGTLPAGLSLSTNGGVISGTPTGTGTSNFTVRATDSHACTGSQALSLTIDPCTHQGDVNGDTFIDGDDINGFVACLISGSVSGSCAQADMDCNTVLNAADVTAFVAKLLGP